nr:hypothetical protein [Tanacetum cinerariifolium]
MDELQQEVAPFLPASGGGMEGFNPPPAPSDNSVFVCIDEPAQEVGKVSQRAPQKRVWQTAFDDSREMRLADKHSLAFDERIQESIDRAKALYANKDLDIQIKKEADIERGVQSFFADIYKFDDHRNQKSTELVEKLKECRRETAKKEVFKLLKANRPQEGKPLTNKEKVELQHKIKDFTLTFKDAEIFPAALEIVKMLIQLELSSAKEYLRARKLTDEDLELGGELGTFTIEALLIHYKYKGYSGEQARYEKLILEMAKAYLGYDFYMPAFIDFRGRIYRSSILHFHERDLARSLIIFSDPKYKKGDEIYKILVTAATFHFKSFSSTVEAQEWCKVVLMPVLKRICESYEKNVWGENLDTHILDEFGIEDPSQDKPGQLSYMDIAKNAKDPLQFLLSKLLNLHTGDPSFRRTNLIPDEKGRLLDIYSCMRDELLDFIKPRGGKGAWTVEPGEAGSFDRNGRLWTMNLLKKALWSKGKCMNSWKKRELAYIKMESSKFDEYIESTNGKPEASNGEERRLGRAIFSYGLHLLPDPEIENPAPSDPFFSASREDLELSPLLFEA